MKQDRVRAFGFESLGLSASSTSQSRFPRASTSARRAASSQAGTTSGLHLVLDPLFGVKVTIRFTSLCLGHARLVLRSMYCHLSHGFVCGTTYVGYRETHDVSTRLRKRVPLSCAETACAIPEVPCVFNDCAFRSAD